MNLRLICYGITKDILGGFEKQIEVADGMTVGELKKELTWRFPDFEKLKSLRIAINTEYADDQSILSTNDEVVLIPPVSGG
jgi:molybdopterin converting factor small subunit